MIDKSVNLFAWYSFYYSYALLETLLIVPLVEWSINQLIYILDIHFSVFLILLWIEDYILAELLILLWMFNHNEIIGYYKKNLLGEKLYAF